MKLYNIMRKLTLFLALIGVFSPQLVVGDVTQDSGNGQPQEVGEKYEFQAEVSRMMDIIINSLYQKKEVFLREVISNGADALDKIRFLSLQHPEELGQGDERTLEMRISYDEDAKTLTIRDTGIGMTKQELIDNLGTVAKSGTTTFFEQLANTDDLNLIGQFGVGFYSVYLVADRVQVRSKSNKDDKQYIWESTADSTFTVSVDPEGNTLRRGTEIKLHLKEDALEYADPARLEALVKRYSEFISFPIYLRKKSVEAVEAADDDDDDEGDEDLEDDEEEEEEPDTESEKVETWKWVRLNNQPAIWTRPSSDVTDEEYQHFFQAISKEGEALTWTHFKAEGEVEFKAILYIPKTAPRGLFENYYSSSSTLKLYVRKVLIKDDFEELLPRYMNFIQGVVDSDDLPLSVSRETLQQAKAIKVISKKLTRKVLDLLKRMSDAEEKTAKPEDVDEEEEEEDEDRPVASYADFYKEFGKNIKLGIVEDSANRNKLSKLLRFKSTTDPERHNAKLVSLQKYVERMPTWQKDIYYITGESLESMLSAPLLKVARGKGIEVLLLDDPMDEYVMQNMQDFEGKKFQSLNKEGVKFGDEKDIDKKREDIYKKEFKGLIDWLRKEVYNVDKSWMVEKIQVSASHVPENLPAIIISGKHGQSAYMSKIMRAQALSTDSARSNYASSQKVMELNPRSPIINKLKELYETGDHQDLETAKNLAWLIYDTCNINSGFELEEPEKFALRMFKMMQRGLSLDSLEPLPWIEVPESVDEEVVEDDSEQKEEL